MTTHEHLLNKYGVTLTFQQASEETGIFWQTIREMCKRGVIKTPKNGSRYVLTTKALAQYLDQEEEAERTKETVMPTPLTGKGYRKIV